MRRWLGARTDFPVIGPLFTEEWMIYLFSYGGLFLDLLFVPLVLWKRTRWFALTVALAFHLTNARLFSIGIFPYFMIAANLLFLPPDWPRRLIAFVRRQPFRPAQNIPVSLSLSARRGILLGLGLWFLLQALIPLRHWLYGGNVSWDEQGHYFSWHMKLRDKDGRAFFTLTDKATGETWSVNGDNFLLSHQRDNVYTTPDMLVQFAHFLRDYYRETEGHDVEVRVRAWVSLNGRAPQLIINPALDLTQIDRTLFKADWVVPLLP